jgi:integrase
LGSVRRETATKSGKERKVPIPAALRVHVAQHLLALGWSEGLVFGNSPADPFVTTGVRFRANLAWKEAKLSPITLHECRHTYASLMIASGVNAKSLSTYMGHSNISITLDRYGHLFSGNENEAAALLDSYLMRSTGANSGAS